MDRNNIHNLGPKAIYEKFKKYGMPGDPIEGSQWLRGYCPRCFAAMRLKDAGGEKHCEDCGDRTVMPPRTGLTSRQKQGLKKTDT